MHLIQNETAFEIGVLGKKFLYIHIKSCILPFPFNHRFYNLDDGGIMPMDLFRSTGMEHMKTFNKLTPYDLDFMCEKIYVAMEQFITNTKQPRSPKLILPFTLPDYKHLYLKGMRDYFFDMTAAQKVSFDHYLEAMRATSYMSNELTPEDIERHRQLFTNSDDSDEKKDPDAKGAQGLKVSAGSRK